MQPAPTGITDKKALTDWVRQYLDLAAQAFKQWIIDGPALPRRVTAAM